MPNSFTIDEKQQEDRGIVYVVGPASNLISPAKSTGCAMRCRIALTCIVQYNLSLSQNHNFLVAGCHFSLSANLNGDFADEEGKEHRA